MENKRGGTCNGFSTTAGIGDNELCRASLGIRWMLVQMVQGAHSDGIDAVGIAIEIAIVTGLSTIARGKHVNAALATTAVLDAIDKCIGKDPSRRLHCTAIIRRTP